MKLKARIFSRSELPIDSRTGFISSILEGFNFPLQAFHPRFDDSDIADSKTLNSISA